MIRRLPLVAALAWPMALPAASAPFPWLRYDIALSGTVAETKATLLASGEDLVREGKSTRWVERIDPATDRVMQMVFHEFMLVDFSREWTLQFVLRKSLSRDSVDPDTPVALGPRQDVETSRHTLSCSLGFNKPCRIRWTDNAGETLNVLIRVTSVNSPFRH